MPTHHATRRQFLKAGCLTGAAAGATVCGISTVAGGSEPAPLRLESFHYGERTLNNHVLVVYATYAGSTMEVAAAIGKTLGERDFAVDVSPIEAQPDVKDYDAIIIGSAVQYGQWLAEAIDFLKTNQQALQQIPVALFCVHIQNLEDDPQSRKNRLAYLNQARAIIQPVAEGYFAGRFDQRGAARLMPKFIARFIPTSDKRDWSKIRAWAQTIFAS